MEPLRTWKIRGENPLTVSLYRPTMTIRLGDGPEAELSPEQIAALSQRFVDVENFFDSGDPEVL